MAQLIYSTIASLDGFVEDRYGAFDWGAPSDELSDFINQRERPIGTYLYGRRMYETMVYWESYETDDAQSSPESEFAKIWRAADKIVYSSTLRAPSSRRTTVERDFEPSSILRMKDTLPSDFSIGGAELASRALNAGLVDEVQSYVKPLVVGAGKPAFASHELVRFELLEEQKFSSGELFLRYRVMK